jgi:hypothetical protein
LLDKHRLSRKKANTKLYGIQLSFYILTLTHNIIWDFCTIINVTLSTDFMKVKNLDSKFSDIHKKQSGILK